MKLIHILLKLESNKLELIIIYNFLFYFFRRIKALTGRDLAFLFSVLLFLETFE